MVIKNLINKFPNSFVESGVVAEIEWRLHSQKMEKMIKKALIVSNT